MENEMKTSVTNTPVNTNKTDTHNRSTSIQNKKCGLRDSSQKLPVSEDVNKEDTSRNEDSLLENFDNGVEYDEIKKKPIETDQEIIGTIFNDLHENQIVYNETVKQNIKGKNHFRRGASSSKMNKNELEISKGNLESDDVSKLLKLWSKPNLIKSSPEKHNCSKTPLKTYNNPRKSLEKAAILESFGLPDTPIVPEKPATDSILDAEILDAKEITIQDLQFDQESWCTLDFHEDFFIVPEIRVKTPPQNNISYSSNNLADSVKCNLNTSTPIKRQNCLAGSSSVSNHKNKCEHIFPNSKTNKPSSIKNKFISSANKPEIIHKKSSLTIEEHEVEFFSSNSVHDSSSVSATTIKTNKLNKTQQKQKRLKGGNTTDGATKTPSNKTKQTTLNEVTASSERRILRSNVTVDNTAFNEVRKLRSSDISRDTTPNERRKLRSSGVEKNIETSEKIKLRSSTPHNSSLKQTHSAQKNNFLNELAINLPTDSNIASTTRQLLRSHSSSDLPNNEISTAQEGKSSSNKSFSIITKTRKANDKLKKISSDSNFLFSSKPTDKKDKCKSDSDVSQNEGLDYLKQLKIILHPLHKKSEATSNTDSNKQLKRRSARVNNLLQNQKPSSIEKKSASCEMILELVDVIPVPDTENYQSLLLKSPPFLKLFKNSECPLPDVLLNKEKVKVNRKPESKHSVFKPNSVLPTVKSNMPSTSRSKDDSNTLSSKSNKIEELSLEVRDKTCDNTPCISTQKTETDEEPEYYKSPIPRSPTKSPSKLKKSPEAAAEIMELKNIIKKISESEGRSCKVVTNEKLSECLKSRQYNRKCQSFNSMSVDNLSLDCLSNDLEDLTDLNLPKESTTLSKNLLSPKDNLRNRTRKIIEMLADDNKEISNNLKSGSKERNIEPLESKSSPHTSNKTIKVQVEKYSTNQRDKQVENKPHNQTETATPLNIVGNKYNNVSIVNGEVLHSEKEKEINVLIEPETKLTDDLQNTSIDTKCVTKGNIQQNQNDKEQNGENLEKVFTVNLDNIEDSKEADTNKDDDLLSPKKQPGRQTKHTSITQDKLGVIQNQSDSNNVLIDAKTNEGVQIANLQTKTNTMEFEEEMEALENREESKETGKNKSSALNCSRNSDNKRKSSRLVKQASVKQERIDLIENITSSMISLVDRKSEQSVSKTNLQQEQNNAENSEQKVEKEFSVSLANTEGLKETNTNKDNASSHTQSSDLLSPKRKLNRPTKQDKRTLIDNKIVSENSFIDTKSEKNDLKKSGDKVEEQSSTNNERSKEIRNNKDDRDILLSPNRKPARPQNHTIVKQDRGNVKNNFDSQNTSVDTKSKQSIDNVNSQKEGSNEKFYSQNTSVDTKSKQCIDNVSLQKEESNERKVSEEVEAGFSADSANTDDSSDVDNSKNILLSPLNTPKRKAGRQRKDTPSKQDVTNVINSKLDTKDVDIDMKLQKEENYDKEDGEEVKADLTKDIDCKKLDDDQIVTSGITKKSESEWSSEQDVKNLTENMSDSQNKILLIKPLQGFQEINLQQKQDSAKIISDDVETKVIVDVAKSEDTEETNIQSSVLDISQENDLLSTSNKRDVSNIPENRPEIESVCIERKSIETVHLTNIQEETDAVTHSEKKFDQSPIVLNVIPCQEVELTSKVGDYEETNKNQNNELGVFQNTENLLSPVDALKRKRGRPRKDIPSKEESVDLQSDDNNMKQKDASPVCELVVKDAQLNIEDGNVNIIKRKRGRPRTSMKEESNPSNNSSNIIPSTIDNVNIDHRLSDCFSTTQEENNGSKTTDNHGKTIKMNGDIKSPIRIKNLEKNNNCSNGSLENVSVLRCVSEKPLIQEKTEDSSSNKKENDSATQDSFNLVPEEKVVLSQPENLLDEEVSSINSKLRDQSQISLNNEVESGSKNDLRKLTGIDCAQESFEKDKIEESLEKPRSKTSVGSLITSSPKRKSNEFKEDGSIGEQENIDPKTPSPRTRSKSCLLRRISVSDIEDDDWSKRTRSKTCLDKKVLYTTDEESECEENVSRRTRSKTSLGDKIPTDGNEDYIQVDKMRSKSSLGEIGSFVNYDVSVSPIRLGRRVSLNTNESLNSEEKRQTRSMGEFVKGDQTKDISDAIKDGCNDSGQREKFVRSKGLVPASGLQNDATEVSKPSTSRRSLDLPDVPKEVTKRSYSLGSKREMLNRFKEIYQKYRQNSFTPRLGDFVWSQIGKYPYWPSLVSTDPETGLFQKVVNKGLHESTVYHVSFFGDKGRRAWISYRRLMEYNSRDDLEKLFDNFKKYKAYSDVQFYYVRSTVKSKWTAAVDAVDFVKSQGFDLRKTMRFLEKGNVESDEESILEDDKKLRNKLNKTIKTEEIDQTTDMKDLSHKKSSKSKKPHTVHDSDTVVGQEGIEQAQKKIKLTTESPSTSKQKLPRKKSTKDSEVSSEASYSLLSPKIEVKEEITNDEEDVVPEFKVSPKALLHFGSYSLEEQKALFKRNNLFKGVPKEKVCHYCFEAGDLLKCRGGCNGLYHPYCATQVLVEKYPKRRKFKSSPIKTEVPVKVESNKVEKFEVASPTANVSGVSELSLAPPEVKKAPEKPPDVDEAHVQIVTIPSTMYNTPPKKTFPPDFINMTLAERIDFKMKEIMKRFESTTYADILSESSSDEKATNSPTMTIGSTSNVQDEPSSYVRQSPQQTSTYQKIQDLFIKSDVQKTPLSLKPFISHITGDSLPPRQEVSHKAIISVNTTPNKHLVTHTNDTKNQIFDNKVINKHMTSKTPVRHVTAESTPVSQSKVTAVNGYRNPLTKHVTADSESVDVLDSKSFRCGFCAEDIDPYCFICNETTSKKGCFMRQKCSLHPCARFYHPDCLKLWPQTQWSLIQTTKNRFSQEELDSFVCPQHVCHTCASDDPRAAISRCPWDKIVKCLCCPASYHSTNFCIPAGTVIISTTQIVCPRHRHKTKPYTINTTWCLLCNEGGNLICCETCPTSVHPECMTVNLTDDDRFICEECESGRLPLYDEVVWVKLGNYKWWPSLVIFPNEVPPKVKSSKHYLGEFVVKFFGTYDYYWMNRGRAFLFQEGDTVETGISTKKKFQVAFMRAVEEAVVAHKMKKQFKIMQAAESAISMKPPPYIKIKSSKPVGNVRLTELDLSNTTACDCEPNQRNPCGPDSNCLNRLLLTECHPEVCPAGKRCKNQSFEKREYPTLVPYRTETRGWGLKTLEPIKKGQFVIEYVGELIDDEEYQRRIQKMHEQKEENYYFLTIHKDRMIDAGPKGNMARFMNHCCQPNCETQKWTVNGETRVGLFATDDIPANKELTFNYNLECTGTEKKVCKCGAPNCSGFIGVKVKNESTELKKPKKEKKKKEPEKPMELPPCFTCQRKGNVSLCNNKICNKAYHLRCLKLKERPDGKKFVCPWHYCNVCSKRTIRCCVKCLNSFCPSHSEGNVRYDNLMGFVCSMHDPTNASSQNMNVTIRKRRNHNLTDESLVTSTTTDNDEVEGESDSPRYRKSKKNRKNNLGEEENSDFNVSDSYTSNLLTGLSEDDSQDETVSSATASDFEEEIRPKRKKKQKRRLQSKKIKLKFKRKNINSKEITANKVNDSVGSNVDM